MSIANRRMLIIGGSSGMRLASAKRLVQAGADVFIAGREAARLDVAVTSLRGRVTGIAADFTDPASLEALMRSIGRLDHLVLAAAGAAAWGPFAQLPVGAVRTALNTKLLGYWQSLQAALPILRRDGSVVFMTGAASRVGR